MAKIRSKTKKIAAICREAWRRGHDFGMAMDAPNSAGTWRTLKKEGQKGRRVLLDKDGNIIGGLGGRFNGVNVSNLRTESQRRARAAKGIAPKALQLSPATQGRNPHPANGNQLQPARRLNNIPAPANGVTLESMHKVSEAPTAANAGPSDKARQALSKGLNTALNPATRAAANSPDSGQPGQHTPPPQPQQTAPAPVNPAMKSAEENAQQAAEIERLKQEISQLKKPKTEQPKPVSIDMTLPEKIPSDVVLQNRSRETEASVVQVRNIAHNLNYHRVAMSNDFNSGSPVVSYGKIPEKNFGNTETLVTPGGKELTVQYAVMEARDISTSNKSNGERNEDYFSDDPNITRAIAGNGRASAIALSYASGHKAASKYKQQLAENAARHGCAPDVIAGMKEPVLVRVMQPKDVTKDIGDQTNTTQGLTLNTIEQARTDIKRMDLTGMKVYDDGSPTVDSVRSFIQGLPETERAGMRTSDGQPTRVAQDRLQNALMMQAYNNDFLVRLRGQAISPTGKNMIAALSNASIDFVKLRGEGAFDISEPVALVAKEFSSEDPPKSGAAFHWKTDMLATPEQNKIAEMIGRKVADNKNSARKLTTIFRNLAKDLKAAGVADDMQKHSTDPFNLSDFDDQLDKERGPATFGGLGLEDVSDRPSSSDRTMQRVYDTITKSLERSMSEIASVRYDSALQAMDSVTAFNLGRAYVLGLAAGHELSPYITYFRSAV